MDDCGQIILPPSDPVSFPETTQFSHTNVRDEVTRNLWTDAIPISKELLSGEKVSFSLDLFPDKWNIYQLSKKELTEDGFIIIYERPDSHYKQGKETIRFVGKSGTNKNSRLTTTFSDSNTRIQHRDSTRVNLCRLFEFLEYLVILHNHNPTSYFDQSHDLTENEGFESLP